ncbi:MAG: ABC transporter transmembrane domain-containing protein, partial [Lachnospiraceae bacterium]|nr:ABC transporter transmembrane domain-containing protein [Lachnospiraceae bacterium]
MKTIQKLRFIFTRKQKIHLALLSMIIVIGAILELVGVTAILPFINVAMSPNSIYKSKPLLFLYNLFHSRSANEFLAILAVMLILIYIIKNAYLLMMNYCIFRFSYNNQRQLSYRLLDAYLMQPYSFFVYHNSADLMRNINTDTSMLFDTVLSAMELAVECIVCLLLLSYLMLTDKSITIGVGTILVGFLFVFIKFFRKNMKDRGQKERKYKARMNRWLLQTFGGIKETKIMEREPFFLKRYDDEYIKYADNHCIYQIFSYLPKPTMETLCIGGVLFVVALKLMRGVGSEYFISTMSVFAVA